MTHNYKPGQAVWMHGRVLRCDDLGRVEVRMDAVGSLNMLQTWVEPEHLDKLTPTEPVATPAPSEDFVDVVQDVLGDLSGPHRQFATESMHEIIKRLRALSPSKAPEERLREAWLPTPTNINALSDPIRRYIHDLETRTDRAGEVRELTIARDTIKQLEAALASPDVAAYGTSKCPICDKEVLHSHTELEQKGYIVALNISNELNHRRPVALHELARLCGYHLAEYERSNVGGALAAAPAEGDLRSLAEEFSRKADTIVGNPDRALAYRECAGSLINLAQKVISETEGQSGLESLREQGLEKLVMGLSQNLHEAKGHPYAFEQCEFLVCSEVRAALAKESK